MKARSSYYLVTEQEYFRREELTDERLEFYDGVVVTLQGSRPEHSLISASLSGILWNRLKGGPCAVYSPDLRVKAGTSSTRYFHPDVTVICGGLQRYAGHENTATNPKLVAEILSDSTALRDRFEKMEAYFELPSMEEYLLVWQAAPAIESYFRGADGEWRIDHVRGLEATLRLRSLDLDIPLAEIYAGVEFPPPEPWDDGESARVAEEATC